MLFRTRAGRQVLGSGDTGEWRRARGGSGKGQGQVERRGLRDRSKGRANPGGWAAPARARWTRMACTAREDQHRHEDAEAAPVLAQAQAQELPVNSSGMLASLFTVVSGHPIVMS